LNPILATWQLLLGMGVLMLGAGLQGTLLGVRATLEGFPAPVIGLVMSCYYVGYLVGTKATPHFVARVGHVRVFAAFTAVASATILLHSALVEPVFWALMRLGSGVCFAGIYVVAESWLNGRASSANRGALLAVYMVILYIGLGASQFLFMLADAGSPSLFILASALISLAVVPMALTVQRTPEITVPRRVRYRDLYRNSPLGVVAVVMSGMVAAILFSFGPVYARLRGFDPQGVSMFMGLSILAAVFTQLPIGRLSDRMDRRTVIGMVCLLAAIVAAFIAALGEDMARPLFLALSAVFGGLVLTLYPLAISHVNDQLEPEQMIDSSSALILLNGLGSVAGPLLMGSLIAAWGAPAYFMTLAALLAALTLYDIWRKFRRHAVAGDQKGPFISAQPQAIAGQIIAAAAREKPEA
jgi:MFS family permease